MNLDALNQIIAYAESQGLDSELVDLAKNELKSIRFELVGFARLNDRGDLYSYRTIENPYLDNNTVISLYCNLQEFDRKYSGKPNA